MKHITMFVNFIPLFLNPAKANVAHWQKRLETPGVRNKEKSQGWNLCIPPQGSGYDNVATCGLHCHYEESNVQQALVFSSDMVHEGSENWTVLSVSAINHKKWKFPHDLQKNHSVFIGHLSSQPYSLWLQSWDTFHKTCRRPQLVHEY